MPNEITIAVTMADETAATKAEIKAGIQEWAAGISPIPVRATSPIDEAWQAQVAADVKATDPGEVVVGVTADTDGVATEVAEARAQVEAAVEPVVIPIETGQIPDLDKLAAEQGAFNPASFRPSYTPGPLFGPEGDPYASARVKIEQSTPIEVPVRAANPIDDAWIAQVKASIRGVANDALQIPVNPGLTDFEAQLESTLASLAATTKLDIPVDVGDAMMFREQVQELVAEVERSVKAVIDVQVNNDSALTELQQKTAAASQATLAEVEAQQKLNEAYASGDADKVAKATQDLESAQKGAKDATEALTVAQAAAAEGATAVAGAEDVAAGASRGLQAAMGPVWMVMNVLQLATMGLYGGFGSTAQQTQNLSQQMIQLGQSAGATATGLVGANQGLQGLQGDFEILGTTSTAFAQQYSGSIDAAAAYTKKLEDQQTSLGNTMVTTSAKTQANNKAGGESAQALSMSIEQVAKSVAGNTDAYNSLDPATREMVDRYNALNDIVPQAKNALEGMRAAAEANKETLAGLGFVMTDGQNKAQQYGLGVQAAAKALQDAVSGSTYLEDATDKASIAAGQGAQQWGQLQAAVASAGQQVENASHSIVTAEQGVESARHSEEQAVLAVTAAQHGYANALYQEGQAQQAVTAARQAAQAALVSLQLQANDAAASALSANVSLFDAQQSAAALGVTPGNAQQIAAEQVTAQNEAQVKAAIALIQAQNQVADSQNASTDAQNNLNTARQQGVDNNPAVLSAEHSLAQAQDAVTTAAQGVTNAQWAQQQSAIAVSNAQWGVVSAEQGLTTAEANLTTAKDASSRSTDQNTLAGAQNRQMIENLFTSYENMTGNEQIAAQMTQTAAEKMGFMSTQVDDVIGAVEGLNGQSATFSITGTPSLNPQQLTQIGNELGMSFSQIENALPGPGQQGYHSSGRAKAAGGPGGGLTWVGEGGPELVDLPHGTEVITNANSMMMVASGDVLPPGHAVGGPVGADAVLAANLPLAAQWGALDVTGQMLHALGGPAVSLPPAGQVDWGAFGGMPGSVPAGVSGVPSSRAANEAAVQAVFSQFGWGSGPEWDAAVKLIMMESGFNNTAQNPTSSAYGIFQFLDCVPLDTEILTQDGWKTWNTVRVGDKTLGYNQNTGRTEWTPIRAKVVKSAQRVVRMKVGNWSARVTPGHRWMAERRTQVPVVEHSELCCPVCGATTSKRGPFRSSMAVQTHLGRAHGLPRGPQPIHRVEEFVRTDSITKAHRLRVAAEVDDTAGNDTLSNAEVALLGWIVGDGHINHANRTVNVSIYQSKTRFLPVIDALLDGIPHSRYVRDRNPGKHLPAVQWRLSAPYARDLLDRSGLLVGTPEQFVLSLSSKQRQVWLDAVWQAEGWSVRSGPDGTVRRLSQNVGAWADAMTLAAYLCGYRPTRYMKERRNSRHSDNWVITLGRPWVGGTEIEFTDVGDEPVWCVNTGLGTWTMRQNGLPMLTGNSTWAGYGVSKTSDPTQQAWGGARYIGGRYQDPLGALAHENAYHWYAGGGPASGRVVVGDRGPELARIPGGSAASSQSVTVDVNINFVGNVDTGYATTFMRAVREGQIQLTAHVNGQTGPVKAG